MVAPGIPGGPLLADWAFMLCSSSVSRTIRKCEFHQRAVHTGKSSWYHDMNILSAILNPLVPAGGSTLHEARIEELWYFMLVCINCREKQLGWEWRHCNYILAQTNNSVNKVHELCPGVALCCVIFCCISAIVNIASELLRLHWNSHAQDQCSKTDYNIGQFIIWIHHERCYYYCVRKTKYSMTVCIFHGSYCNKCCLI